MPALSNIAIKCMPYSFDLMLILNPSITQHLVECLGESKYFALTLLSLSTKPMSLKKDNSFVQKPHHLQRYSS